MSPAAARQLSIETVMVRIGAYVQTFVDSFANVVAEETYLQQFRQRAGRRTLKSDFLLVKYPGQEKLLLTFRDVLAVNDRPVHDQQERITRLFLEPFEDAVRRAGEIQREGLRHSLDRGRLMDPLGVMSFLQELYQENFTFKHGGRAPQLGDDVILVEGEQKIEPRAGAAVQPLRLKAWVSERSGRIVRTQLLSGRSPNVRFTTTSFATDPGLRIDVPIEMRDEVPITMEDDFIGVAQYRNFRRFTVRAEETLELRLIDDADVRQISKPFRVV